jgi:hypothetical protein
LIEMQTSRGKHGEATASARRGLRHFGVRLPERVGAAAILRELMVTRYHQGRRTLAELAEMQESRDEHTRCAMQILMAAAPPAYFSDRALLSVVMLKLASLSLKHGATAHSAYGFVGYGMVMSGAFGKYQKGLALGELGIRLDERFGTGELEAKLYHIVGGFLAPWVRPYAEALAHERRAMDAGLRIGDMAYRTYAATGSSFIIEQHAGIDAILQSADAAIDIAQRNRDFDQLMLQRVRRRAYQRLCEPGADATSLADNAGTELELRAQLTDEQTPMATAAYFALKAMLFYFFGEYEAAWPPALEMSKREGAHFAFVTLVNHALMQVLIATQLASRFAQERSGAVDARQLRAAIHNGLSKLRKWAHASPEKFEAWYLLAKADAQRAAGHPDRAAAGYQAALVAAKKTGAARIEALALELSAQHWRARGASTRADMELRAAILAYERWGAHAKAAQLRAHDSHSIEPALPPGAP